MLRTMRCALVALAVISCSGPIIAASTVRYYKATIAPTTATAASYNAYSLTITDCDAASCGAANVTTDTQGFGSVGVTIPAGFVVVGMPTVSATGSKVWSVSVSGSTIALGAVRGKNDKLAPGESLTISFNATAPCASGSYQWLTAVYQDTLGEDGTLNTATPYSRVGSIPAVDVTGECSTHFSPGDYCTYTQGGWGAQPNGGNPGQILSSNFGLFSAGVTVGVTRSMLFTTAEAIEGYLPAGGPSGALTESLTNPTSTPAGVFGGQVLALRLNIELNNNSVIAGTKGSISSLKLKGTGTSLDGQTVTAILAAAEVALGGGALPAGYTKLSDLSDLIELLNEAFDNCGPTDWAQAHLTAQ